LGFEGWDTLTADLMSEPADAAHRVRHGAEQGLDADRERARGDAIIVMAAAV